MWAKHPEIAKSWAKEEKSGHYKKKKSSGKKYSSEHVRMARKMM